MSEIVALSEDELSRIVNGLTILDRYELLGGMVLESNRLSVPSCLISVCEYDELEQLGWQLLDGVWIWKREVGK